MRLAIREGDGAQTAPFFLFRRLAIGRSEFGDNNADCFTNGIFAGRRVGR